MSLEPENLVQASNGLQWPGIGIFQWRRSQKIMHERLKELLRKRKRRSSGDGFGSKEEWTQFGDRVLNMPHRFTASCFDWAKGVSHSPRDSWLLGEIT